MTMQYNYKIILSPIWLMLPSSISDNLDASPPNKQAFSMQAHIAYMPPLPQSKSDLPLLSSSFLPFSLSLWLVNWTITCSQVIHHRNMSQFRSGCAHNGWPAMNEYVQCIFLARVRYTLVTILVTWAESGCRFKDFQKVTCLVGSQ